METSEGNQRTDQGAAAPDEGAGERTWDAFARPVFVADPTLKEITPPAPRSLEEYLAMQEALAYVQAWVDHGLPLRALRFHRPWETRTVEGSIEPLPPRRGNE